MTIFERTDSDNKDFQTLVNLLDVELAVRDGDEHAFYSQFNITGNMRNVVICYMNRIPVACGSFREHEKRIAEIKRMFVLPAFRGKGIGYKVLKELEIWAAELDYSECILETGKNQPEAISLYKKSGYSLIANYGPYQSVDNSVCLLKSI